MEAERCSVERKTPREDADGGRDVGEGARRVARRSADGGAASFRSVFSPLTAKIA